QKPKSSPSVKLKSQSVPTVRDEISGWPCQHDARGPRVSHPRRRVAVGGFVTIEATIGSDVVLRGLVRHGGRRLEVSPGAGRLRLGGQCRHIAGARGLSLGGKRRHLTRARGLSLSGKRRHLTRARGLSLSGKRRHLTRTRGLRLGGPRRHKA